MTLKTYNPQKLQSPVIVPPESISQNWISKDNFDLNQNLTISFKFKSANTTNKELAFSIFLLDKPYTDSFGGTTMKSGLIDYSTKGEVGEGLDKDGNKGEYTYKGITYDLLLDHVYPFSEQSLCKNQNPFDTLGFNNINELSIAFDSTKNIFKGIQDAYHNIYFEELIVQDIVTELEADPLTYSNPIFIQIKNILYVLNFELNGIPLDILNLTNYIIRFSFENYGKLLKIDILPPDSTSYVPLLMKYINIDLKSPKDLKLGYGIASPIESYDKDKIANFEIVDFHIQGRLK